MADAVLLAGIARAIGGRTFTAVELLAFAHTDRAVRAILARARCRTAQALGKRLAAIARAPEPGPFGLVAACRDNRGLVYAVHPQ